MEARKYVFSVDSEIAEMFGMSGIAAEYGREQGKEATIRVLEGSAVYCGEEKNRVYSVMIAVTFPQKSRKTLGSEDARRPFRALSEEEELRFVRGLAAKLKAKVAKARDVYIEKMIVLLFDEKSA
jgi:hypothetical protein